MTFQRTRRHGPAQQGRGGLRFIEAEQEWFEQWKPGQEMADMARGGCLIRLEFFIPREHQEEFAEAENDSVALLSALQSIQKKIEEGG